MADCGHKRKRGDGERSHKHPYLSGNFAPVNQTRPLTPCAYEGTIPHELLGGQYVRNGGNPVSNEDLGRDAHWFDGDGMLAGVVFQKPADGGGQVQPHFVNQYILTDLLLSTLATPSLKSPILPSIATMVNPASSLLKIALRVLRAILLVILSRLPGSKQAINKISVANTAVVYHDGRALATCESGPPMRVQLPGLETVGWFNGNNADGEVATPEDRKAPVLGGDGLLGSMREWTTGHPKIDPVTNEMVLFHCAFVSPYIHYSVIPATHQTPVGLPQSPRSKLINAPVPGVSGAKMMHDFGVSLAHTVIMDLPLTLDPLNLFKNQPVVSYDSTKPSRFGVFPRRDPSNVRWFETSACCIFHTANTWESYDSQGNATAVNLLACRLTSASLVFSVGNIAAPQPTQETIEEVAKAMPFFAKYDHDDSCDGTEDDKTVSFKHCGFDRAPDLESPRHECTPLLSRQHHPDSPRPTSTPVEADQCRLYYYRFSLDPAGNTIARQHALSAMPFEFPSLTPAREMQRARYVYGCSTSCSSTFGAALGRAAKIDVLAKVDVETLIERGERDPPRAVSGCVDARGINEVLASQDENDPISCFQLPEGWFTQEPRFVPRKDAVTEDDGFLLFYAFDERQLDAEGECPPDAVSELWVLDAKNMREVVVRVRLPQRVPYGLHANWFSEGQIREQRPVESVRSVEAVQSSGQEEGGFFWRRWMGARKVLEAALG